MYIRETRTKSKITGEGYYTYRLVHCERVSGTVRQITLLNLGKHFALEKDEWPLLCNRIEQLLHPQPFLFDLSCPITINCHGDQMTRFGVRYLLQKYVAVSANIAPSLTGKRIHPHSLRHTTAIHLLKAGIDFATISQ